MAVTGCASWPGADFYQLGVQLGLGPITGAGLRVIYTPNVADPPTLSLRKVKPDLKALW